MGAMNDAARPHEYFELSSKGVGDGANQTTPSRARRKFGIVSRTLDSSIRLKVTRRRRHNAKRRYGTHTK